MLTLKIDDRKLREKLSLLPGVANKAARGAIRNTLVFDVTGRGGKDTLASYMDGTLQKYVDRPTLFTSNGAGSAFYSSVPDSGPIQGVFGVKRRQGAYLQFMAKGIPRDEKIIERRTPDGKLMVPGKKMVLDKHGNIPRKFYEAIYKAAFSRKKNSQFFYLKKGGKIPSGIYEKKKGGGIDLKFLTVEKTRYAKQWDFFGLAQSWIEKRMPVAIQDAIQFRLKKGL